MTVLEPYRSRRERDQVQLAPLPPPDQTAFRQAIRIASARPLLFTVSMALFAAFYALPLLSGIVQRAVFDTLSGHAHAGLNVWTLVGLWFAAQILPLVFSYFTPWAFVTFTSASRLMIRTNMMGWIMFARGSRPSPGTPGEALSRFRDDVAEVIAFIEGWAETFGQAVFAVLALWIMWGINSTVTFAVIAPMILMVFITQKITAGVHRYSRVAREAEARVTSFVGETFTAVQAVRVAGAEARVLGRLADLNETRRLTAVRHRIYVTLLDTFGAGTSSLALGLVLLLAAESMKSGAFSVGDFTLFAAYVGAATSAPRWLGRLLARKRTADVALMRIERLLGDAPRARITEMTPQGPEPTGTHTPLKTLEVRGMTCRHGGGDGKGVEDVSFTLTKGTVTIVTGRVGAGKTTLLRGLLGLLPVQSGEVLWNGESVADPATFLVPPRCAYTGQTPRLFTESLADNIAMGLNLSAGDMDRAVRLAVLEDDVARLAEGLQTRVGTRGVTLSGGQVQRSAAARMFARRTDLLVFDDASSALDVRTEHAFWMRLFSQGDDRPTCLAVSHRLEAYRRADQILVMDGGCIAARGDLRTLLAQSPLFHEIWSETVRASGQGGAETTALPTH
ncbi:MAG: ABC transporter ATP-binding protein [Alphaproteobacteria bacterium]